MKEGLIGWRQLRLWLQTTKTNYDFTTMILLIDLVFWFWFVWCVFYSSLGNPVLGVLMIVIAIMVWFHLLRLLSLAVSDQQRHRRSCPLTLLLLFAVRTIPIRRRQRFRTASIARREVVREEDSPLTTIAIVCYYCCCGCSCCWLEACDAIYWWWCVWCGLQWWLWLWLWLYVSLCEWGKR